MKRAFQLAVCLFLALVAICIEDVTPFPRDSGATADEMVTLFQTSPLQAFGNWGLMDRSNKVVIKPEYEEILVRGNLAVAKDEFGIGVFTTDGVCLAPCIFDMVLANGALFDSSRMGWGVAAGRKPPTTIPDMPIILASNWRSGETEWDGLALRMDGTPLLSAEYRFRELIGDKYLLAARILDGKLRVFDAEGSDVGGRDFDDFARPNFARRTQDLPVRWGWLVYTDKPPDPPLLLMRAGGKLLVYSASLQRLSDAEFDEAGGYSDGMLSVRIGSRWGFVDAESKLAIPPRFDWVSAFFEGFCVVAARLLPNGEFDPKDLTNPAQQGDRPYDVPLGYIDKKGDFLLKPQFRRADDFENGIARTSTISADIFSSAFTCYDKSGQKIVPDKMMLGHYELLGDRIIWDSNNLLHWKSNGELIVYYSVYATYDAKSGLVFFEEQGCKGFIDPRHRFVWSTMCEEIKPFAEGLLLVKEKGKARLISYSGQQVGPDYAEVGNLSEGFALFRMPDS
ncbi:MAG: WG repeat-containing protein, partial [Candidatus Brocadiia bacterium]